MTTPSGLFSLLWVFTVLSALGVSGATPKRIVNGSVAAHRPDQIVVAAYGDTRTGPYGLGDNSRQRIHKAVVRQLLTNEDIDAVIFTGDAVMTNFPLWAKGYWRAFFKQTDGIVKGKGIAFFPSLGNHETYDAIPAFTLPKNAQPSSAFGSPGTNVELAVSKAYDFGEESAAASATELGSRIDPNTSEGQEFVNRLLSDLERGSPESRIKAAQAYGQFEGAIQNEFYRADGSTRCGKDAETFCDRYVKQAGYEYLKPYTSDLKRSYANRQLAGVTSR